MAPKGRGSLRGRESSGSNRSMFERSASGRPGGGGAPGGRGVGGVQSLDVRKVGLGEPRTAFALELPSRVGGRAKAGGAKPRPAPCSTSRTRPQYQRISASAGRDRKACRHGRISTHAQKNHQSTAPVTRKR